MCYESTTNVHVHAAYSADFSGMCYGSECRVEGLAVPEIITREVAEIDELETDASEIQYDTVAIPEIHLRKKK